MFDHVAYDLPQVARNLGVQPQNLLNLIKHGLLTATKASNRNILIADQDLFIFLERCLVHRTSNAASPQACSNPIWDQAERLVEPIKAHLAGQYFRERFVNERLEQLQTSWRLRQVG